MPPVRSVTNQYHGINAHLQSWLQYASEWNGFHVIHIAHLATTLAAQLRPIGYEVRVVLSLNDDDLADYKALAIYKTPEPHRGRGEPEAWLELVSPPKQQPLEDAETYETKRTRLLQRGVAFIEIDYLHEYPATFKVLPSYQEGDSQAYPYSIIIMDPRPDFKKGTTRIYSFNVDQPVPSVGIPLDGHNTMRFDLGVPYKKTFEEMFYGDKVDYTQLPVNFDTYSAADQTRIAARMLAVVEAAARGDNLESGAPLPIRSVTLAEALAEIQRLTLA